VLIVLSYLNNSCFSFTSFCFEYLKAMCFLFFYSFLDLLFLSPCLSVNLLHTASTVCLGFGLGLGLGLELGLVLGLGL
jgi:hypothetical protein